jgi:hypothetical protein
MKPHNYEPVIGLENHALLLTIKVYLFPDIIKEWK